MEEAKNREGPTIEATVQCCIVAPEIASFERGKGVSGAVGSVSGALRLVRGVAAPVRAAIFHTMRPLQWALHRACPVRSRLHRSTASRTVDATLLCCAVFLAACGGDSTGTGSGVSSRAGLPATGLWYATTFDSEVVPFTYGESMRLDSAWHVIEADGSTRLFVASSDERFVTTIDSIEGRFVRADSEGKIQLLYASGSDDPYPPSPVTVTRDSLIVEDGATHLIDVYARRR